MDVSGIVCLILYPAMFVVDASRHNNNKSCIHNCLQCEPNRQSEYVDEDRVLLCIVLI